jgi:hypothetical protein
MNAAPGALSRWLGGEEGVEDALERGRIGLAVVHGGVSGHHCTPNIANQCTTKAGEAKPSVLQRVVAQRAAVTASAIEDGSRIYQVLARMRHEARPHGRDCHTPGHREGEKGSVMALLLRLVRCSRPVRKAAHCLTNSATNTRSGVA